MKLSVTIFALLAGVCISAQATTISIGNLPGGQPVPIADSAGTIISKGGGFAAIGTFAAGTAFSDVAGISGAFQQFGNSTALTIADGLYQNTVTATVAGSAFSAASVFSVVGNGSDLASSTALLVIDHGFSFVDEPGATDGAVVSTASNAVFGASLGGLVVNGTAFDGFQMAGGGGGPVIPEPSSALLGLLGLSFLVFRRRK